VSCDVFLGDRFRQIVRSYPKPRRAEIVRAIDRLQESLGHPHQHAGLGIRKLARTYFEMRVGLELRLVFKIERNTIIFTFAGTHGEIRKFLKQV